MKFYEDEIYVKMCEKAGEIQIHQIPIINSLGDGVFFIKDFVWYQQPDESKAFQVFRQNQLQEMIAKKFTVEKLHEFVEFVVTIYNPICMKVMGGMVGCEGQMTIEELESPYNSYEKLWLHYVMKELFNKSWNGEEWK